MPLDAETKVRIAELVGAGVIVIALISFTLWYMASHPAPTPPTLPAPLPEPTLPSIEEHAQYYDIEAHYPSQTTLLSKEANLAAIASMKSFVEDTVTTFKKEGDFEHLSPEDIQIMGFADGRRESLTIDFTEQKGHRTLSYIFTIYLDTLGAHPNGFYRTFVFDTETGKELALADLFLPKTAYLKKLSTLSREALTETLGESANIDYINEGTMPETASFANFVIEDTTLVIIFPPYQVAPYSAGSQQVSIPLADIQDILKLVYRP